MDDWLPVDLHIHTALSPCADNQMTPNNIVNMAKLLGLKVIAVTDHQAADNVRSVRQLATRAGILCIPGMEVQTREEIHVLCYFADMDTLDSFAAKVDASLDQRFAANVRFGDQLVLGENDEVLHGKRVLLSQSADMSLEQVWALVERLDGCCIPAHIDRPAYSLLGQLGFMPADIRVDTVELSMHGAINGWMLPHLGRVGSNIITSSDAHSLEQMVVPGHTRLAPEIASVEDILLVMKSFRPGALRTFVED